MRTISTFALWIPMALLLGACARSSGLDDLAASYVKLVLAVGRHDPLYVDAYYGPEAWKREADAGAAVPIAELLARSDALLVSLSRADGPADRKRYLEKQLVAVRGYLSRLSGTPMSLAEECRVLYDADPPRHDTGEFARAHEALERLVPGGGPLGPRIEAMRQSIYVPPERIEATLAAALTAVRGATSGLIALPAGEAFETVLVRGKPWGAYNWYLGNFKSRIELNVDLPTELNGLLGTMCHEGYPGHHVYNVLLEEALVARRGWVEYTVYPLYSPQSLLAEGSANVGIDIAYTDAERRRVVAEVLGPAAGVPKEAILAWEAIREAMKPLRYVHGEAARLLLDDGRPEDEVAAFIARWDLVTDERARKSVDFARTYRSYVFNYSLGEDIVRRHVGEGPDRVRRFFDILSRPVVPSDL